MSGILFLYTQDMDEIRKFYQKEIGMSLWLDQGGCVILKHGNLMLGFCEGEVKPLGGLITFFYRTKKEVDTLYQQAALQAVSSPEVNEKFNIYHFFAQDPEGRRLEFQQFLGPLDPYLSGDELLLYRDEAFKFDERDLPDAILRKLFALCRYPSSTESQTYTFSVIRDAERRTSLINLLGEMNETITTAPMIIVVSSGRKVEPDWMKEVYSSAYHFSLAARLHGLVTTWIADLDQDGVRKLLNLPKDENIFLAIFVGYPMEVKGSTKTEVMTSRIRFID